MILKEPFDALDQIRQHHAVQPWLDAVLNFGRWFNRAAGRAGSLTAEAARRSRHGLHGLSHSRAAFA